MSKGSKFQLSRRQFTLAGAATAALAGSGLPLRKARAAAPLKVGNLLPRSGVQALIGQQVQRGKDVALKLLKEMGHDIQLMNADTESNVDVARNQAEKLIREGAQILIGSFDSGQTAAVAQVAEQKGIPYVINIAADPKITEQGYQFVFRNFPTAVMLTKGGLETLKTMLAATGAKPTSAVMTHVNDSFGMAMLNVITKMAPDMGLPFTIKETIAYDPKALDLSVEVSKAKAAKADIHLHVGRLNDSILLVQEMVKQGYETMGVVSPGSPGMYEKQFFKTLGKYANFVQTNVPWLNPKQELTGRLEKIFNADFPDQTFELNIGFAFEGLYICADAYKRAGSADPKALVEALRKTKLEKRVMTGGAIEFDAKGQNGNHAIACVQNLDGKPVVVLPEASAQAKPVFPVPAFNKR